MVSTIFSRTQARSKNQHFVQKLQKYKWPWKSGPEECGSEECGPEKCGPSGLKWVTIQKWNRLYM